MTNTVGRRPLAALRRAASRTFSERRLPPYVGEYVRGRARVGVAAVWRRIEPVVRAPGRALMARRLGVLLAAGPSRRLVHVAGRWQVAVPFEHESVASVAVEHRRTVVDALGQAGVSARTWDGDVVVSVADRPAALAALAAKAGRTSDPVYVVAGRVAELLASPGGAASARLATSPEWSVYRNHWLSEHLVVGQDQACRIRFEDVLPAASRLRAGAEGDFAIDVVYTWVDDADPAWRHAYDEALRSFPSESAHALAANASRYRNRDEIRYSMRSLALHAPWVRRIFLVTCGHVPPWLDTADERIRLVRHDEILDSSCLPTFNSHAIESALHRIPGIAERYLYCNDDFFFGRPVAPSIFFLADGTPCCFPDEMAPIPDGPPTERDAPVDAAAKNVRDVVEARFGARPATKMRHAPYPQLKSLLMEIEHELAGELARTAASRFRSIDDLSVASCLSHHYGLATGRAVTAPLSSEYVNVADRWAPIRMERLLALRDRDVFCLNETEVPENLRRRVDRMVARFLNEYFPVAGPLEAAYPGFDPAETGRLGRGVHEGEQ